MLGHVNLFLLSANLRGVTMDTDGHHINKTPAWVVWHLILLVFFFFAQV